MNRKVAFYVMSRRGLYALQKFIENFGVAAIDGVVGAADPAVKDDPYSEIVALALQHGIPFYDRNVKQPPFTSGTLKFAVGWRWLIQDAENLIVFHDSLLPKYRGFAPLVNCLVKGERATGVSAIFAAEEYDKGKIIAQKSVAIDYPIKIKHAIEKIEPLYAALIAEIYTDWMAGSDITGVSQLESDATYSPWLDEQDYAIDWSWPADKIKRFIDAVGYPYAGARTRVADQIYIIEEAEVMKDLVVENRPRHLGKIISMRDGIPVVICGDGLLALQQMTTPAGDACKINFRSRFHA
jgi:methionyl-tRNA formyltransferase